MPREHIILECTEARDAGKPVSRYMSTRNKKLQQGRVEKKKYNPSLKRQKGSHNGCPEKRNPLWIGLQLILDVLGLEESM
jgi:large subunit ribosomal protein L33